MPAAVVAVAGMAAGAGVVSALGGAAVLGAVGAAVVSGVTSVAVSSVLGGALGTNKPPQSYQPADIARGLLLNSAGTVDPLQVIYGRRRIGGTRCLTEVSGSSNEYLHLVIAHCEGEVSAINAVYLDNVAATDAKYTGLVTVETYVGTDTQTASAALVSALPGLWTTDHRLRGIAYTYIKLKYDQNVFTGMPTVTADIDGRKVYDPRDATWKFSRNPALCLRDYLTNARFGRGIDAALLDDASFSAAANYCDQSVTTPSGSQARYSCNGIVNTDRASVDNVRLLLTCMRGMLVFSGGKYKLVLDQAAVAGFTFTEDHIIGSWQIALGTKRNMFNRVRASWYNPDNDWNPDLALADSSSYRAADNGLLLEDQIDLPFTANTYEAQTLADRHLKQSRFGTVVTFRATIAGLLCEVGDVVNITHSTPGYSAKPFRILRMGLLNSDEVDVTALEYDGSVYADAALTAPRTTPTTNLPDPATVAVPTNLNVTLENITQPDGAIIPRFVSSWTAASDAFVVGYEVAWREDGGPWDTTTAMATRWTIPASVTGRSYDVRVRSINSLSVRSAWLTSNGNICTAPAVAPAAPTATVTGAMFSVHCAWSFGDARQDIRGTEIWWASSNDRSTAALLTLVPFAAREYNHVGLSAGQGGYYWFRVPDTFGNESAWYPSGATSGLYAAASADPSALLTQLKGAVGMPQLAADLASPITLSPGALNANAIAAIQSALSDYDLTNRMQWQEAVTNATITTDPATGKFQLLATAAVTTDVEARLTAVETTANADHGTLTSTVTTLSTVQGSLTAAQGQITTLAGQVATSASQVYVDNSVANATGAINVTAAQAYTNLAVAEIQAALDMFAGQQTALTLTANVANAQSTLQAHADALAAEAVNRSALVAVVAGQGAMLTTEQAARVSGDTANAIDITALAARLNNGDFAAVKVQSAANASALGTVTAEWGVQVQVMADGKRALAGLKLLAGNDGESVVGILADRLLVYKPDGSGTPKQIVILGTINGATALGLDGNLIVDGSIVTRMLAAGIVTADKMNVTALSAISANLGTVTAGSINIGGGHAVINADGSAYFDNITVVRQLSVATGAASGLAGTYGVTPGDGWKLLNTVTVDTGYVVGAWWSASDRVYQASAGINGGTVTLWAYSGNYGTFYANWAVVVKRIYPKSRWNTSTTLMLELELWAEVDGQSYQINVPAPSWALFKVT